MRNLKRHQRGATLLVGLIMLVLITLLAVSSFNLGKSNLQIVANMQHRTEAMESAKATIEEVISKTNFSETPSNALTGGCSTNTKCFDVNSDGANDITVTLTPTPCIKKSQTLKNTQLDYSDPEDTACLIGNSQNPGLGVSGSSSGDSLCADTVWEITAVATDSITQARYTAVQGVAVRVAADAASGTTNQCP